MTSINPLQATLQNLYAQLGGHVPHASQAVKGDHNVLHRLGLNAASLQDLRHDLNAVAHGPNSDRAVDNLLAGLQQILVSTPAHAKEWPAGKEHPVGTQHLDLVKGEDGKPVPMAQEWPAGKEHPVGTQHLDLVKGEDGKPVPMAQEWPAGKEHPDGTQHLDLVKGEDGKPVPMAQEWPAGKEYPVGTQHLGLVKGKDGEPQEVESSAAQCSSLGGNASLQEHTDALALSLNEFLHAEAVGGELAQVAVNLRSQLQSFFNNVPLDSNPEWVRDALRKSIRSSV